MVDTSVQSLDGKMQSILNNKSLSEEQKAQLYGSFLQEYLTMKKKQTKVYQAQEANLPVPVPEAPAGESPPPPHPPQSAEGAAVEREIVQSVPKQVQRQAVLLVERIRKHPDLDWNDQGELVVEGTPIPHSNMVDLINDLVRSRKGFNPVGWEALASQLRKGNVPQDLVRNPRRWQYIQGLGGSSPGPLSASAVSTGIQGLETPSPISRWMGMGRAHGRVRQDTPRPVGRGRASGSQLLSSWETL